MFHRFIAWRSRALAANLLVWRKRRSFKCKTLTRLFYFVLCCLQFKDAKTVKPHQITLVGAKQSGGVLRVKDVSDLYDGIQIEVVLPEVLSFSPPPVAHHSTKASIPNSPASARIGSGTSSPISGTPPARKKVKNVSGPLCVELLLFIIVIFQTFMDKLTGNRPRSTSEHSAEIAGFDVSRTQSSGGGTLTDGRPHRLSVHSYKKPTFCDDCQVTCPPPPPLFFFFFSLYLVCRNLSLV